jgi:hypothetical protein
MFIFCLSKLKANTQYKAYSEIRLALKLHTMNFNDIMIRIGNWWEAFDFEGTMSETVCTIIEWITARFAKAK